LGAGNWVLDRNGERVVGVGGGDQHLLLDFVDLGLEVLEPLERGVEAVFAKFVLAFRQVPDEFVGDGVGVLDSVVGVALRGGDPQCAALLIGGDGHLRGERGGRPAEVDRLSGPLGDFPGGGEQLELVEGLWVGEHRAGARGARHEQRVVGVPGGDRVGRLLRFGEPGDCGAGDSEDHHDPPESSKSVGGSRAVHSAPRLPTLMVRTRAIVGGGRPEHSQLVPVSMECAWPLRVDEYLVEVASVVRKHPRRVLVKRILRDVRVHPANKEHPNSAVDRAVGWQVRKRFSRGDVQVSAYGLDLVLPRSSGSLSNFFYFGERFEWDTINFIERFLRPGDVVLDVGANVGMFAYAAARRVGEDGRVICFEPLPWAAATIERSCTGWQHLTNSPPWSSPPTSTSAVTWCGPRRPVSAVDR
jgi:hypothetical protein